MCMVKFWSSKLIFYIAPAKKPVDTPSKQKKAPVKAKKPDTSIWDSDSDTGTKKPPASKGGGKGRSKKRKQSSLEEDEYSPMKKHGKSATSRVSDTYFITAFTQTLFVLFEWLDDD